MADLIDDDWDSSVPIGSPSSSLPQAIKEVLESVRAEISAGEFGTFRGSNVDKPPSMIEMNVSHKGKLSCDGEQTMEVDGIQGMVVESHDQTKVNFDKNHESQTEPRLVASQSSALEKTAKTPRNLTDESNSDAGKEAVTTYQVKEAQDGGRNMEGAPGAGNAQSQVSVAGKLKPMYEQVILGQHTGFQIEQEDSMKPKREMFNANKILADYQKTKVAHWIKIDWPTKKIVSESESLPNVNPKEFERMGTLGRKTPMGDWSGMNRVDTNSLKKVTSENQVTNPMPETQMTRSFDTTDNLQSPRHTIEESTKRQKANESPLLGNKLDIGEVKMWPSENFEMAEVETQNQEQSRECFPVQKQVTVAHPGYLSGDEKQVQHRVHEKTSCRDLGNDSQLSECQSFETRVSNRCEQGTFSEIEERESDGVVEILDEEWMMDEKLDLVERNKTPNEDSIKHKKCQNQSTDDSETSLEVQESSSSQTPGRPKSWKENEQLSDFKVGSFHVNENYQVDNTPLSETDSDEMDIGDVKIQISHNTLASEELRKDETLHKELREKYMNMNFTKEIKKEYQDYEPLCVEIEELARACDDSPTKEVMNRELFNNDKLQEIYRNTIEGNAITSETGKGDLYQESGKDSVSIWRRELLISDFNLMYGSLRAVLMGNTSHEDRHRLIQTMIATMSEIEEVTMGEGNPTQDSVRCETPELITGFDEPEENEKGAYSGKEIKKEVAPSRLQESGDQDPTEKIIQFELTCDDRASLRERESKMNVERVEKLMLKNLDGTLTCLVCFKSGIPRGRTCRACTASAFRVERNYTIGIPIPTCDHANYSGSPKCKSCRYRKFSFMGMTDTDARVRSINAKFCPVCKTFSYHFRGWKCNKCYFFFLKLMRNKAPRPTCQHFGEMIHVCDGCRRYNLQEEWATHEKKGPYPLPLIKKNTH